ncbi:MULTISPECIES: ABC transporter ATP-binding protein [Streptomyces]|uniref:Sugar ABC transporter ATP-binding protein n=1 Tax=Streptomyces viridochromogenes TaxID=1938 RepID=A0A0L8L9R5_STRVR|nr:MULTISPECIES: ABC transporter ATP-binding protein [Streptomyces]KOG34887.1 sugar ABC transporter ATP-binding protein [Streptomyces viridochromogenes]
MSRAIVLRDVSKNYGGSPVVRRVSLTVEPGEFLVLLGPSGCGKSTVLRMIAGLEDITDGDLFLDGEHANDVPPRERDIAMVFQNFALYPSMTSRENIGFPLKLRDPSADHDPQVEATARMLAIEDLLDRLPGQLSGGERQRVAMGRAISRRPSVFLLDEPLSSLDAKLRGHLRAEIARLTAELGVTTVYVTHDQSEAMSLGDRVAVMRDGVLQQVSPPQELYARPVNVFVAAFVGTPRINLLDAVVHAPLDGPMSLELGRQRLVLPLPLSVDHQLLRIQQGRPIIVGLRSEAVRIAPPSQARPGEASLVGIVEHVEYQGHEVLVHLDTGSRPAVVADLEAARPRAGGRRGSGRRKRGLGRIGARAAALGVGRIRARAAAFGGSQTSAEGLPAGPAAEGRPAADPAAGRGPSGEPYAARERRTAGRSDLVLRTGPHVRVRAGAQVPLLVDLAQLYVFDHQGTRICPAPDALPGLDR